MAAEFSIYKGVLTLDNKDLNQVKKEFAMLRGSLLFMCFSLMSLGSLASSGRVGDRITLSGDSNGVQVVINASYVSYAPDRMQQRSQTLVNGNTVGVEDTFLMDDEILTPEGTGLIVALCDQIGGTHEYLALTVGQTLTCKMAADALTHSPIPYHNELAKMGDFVWFGPFPVMGVAKLEAQGTTLTIQDYSWNN